MGPKDSEQRLQQLILELGPLVEKADVALQLYWPDLEVVLEGSIVEEFRVALDAIQAIGRALEKAAGGADALVQLETEDVTGKLFFRKSLEDLEFSEVSTELALQFYPELSRMVTVTMEKLHSPESPSLTPYSTAEFLQCIVAAMALRDDIVHKYDSME